MQTAVNPLDQAKQDIIAEAERTAQQYSALAGEPVEQEELREGIKNTIQLMREKVESQNHVESYLTLFWIYHMSTAVEII